MSSQEKTIKNRSGQNFITGAAILAVAGVLVKIISACFKIPITNLVGAQAMSYFNTAYTVYNLLINISSVGLSVAVAKCISEYVALGQHRDVKSVIKAANTSLVMVGLACSILFFVFAEDIAVWLNNPMAAPACRVMSPAILLVAVSSVYKGYAQGYSNMVPSAISNIIEVLSKLIFGLGGAYVMMEMGYDMPLVMAGAVGGVSLGALLSMIYLIISKHIYKRKMDAVYPITALTPPPTRFQSVLKKFIWIAVPITVGSLTSNLASTIDLAIVMRRLTEIPGVTTEVANTLYGAYSSMSQTVFNMPSTIIISIGVSVLPAISASFALKQRDRLNNTINTAIKLCTLVAMPCAFGMTVLAKPILDLLYSSPSDIAIAWRPLAYLGVAFFFMCCAAVCTPLLQAVGKAMVPVVNILIASVIKIICNYVLVAIPGIGIDGAAISNIVLYVVLFALNFISLRRITKTKADIKSVYIKPLLGGILCGAVAWGGYALFSKVISSSIATIAAIGLAAVVYVGYILFSKTIKREDIEFLPKAKKIEKILEKRNWIG